MLLDLDISNEILHFMDSMCFFVFSTFGTVRKSNKQTAGGTQWARQHLWSKIVLSLEMQHGSRLFGPMSMLIMDHLFTLVPALFTCSHK